MFNMSNKASLHKLIKECIYYNDKELFDTIEDRAISFASRYIGNGLIIQDDIFNVIKNYAQGAHLLLFPTQVLRFYKMTICVLQLFTME